MHNLYFLHVKKHDARDFSPAAGTHERIDDQRVIVGTVLEDPADEIRADEARAARDEPGLRNH